MAPPVFQGEFTRWSIVYDIPDLAVHFRTREAPAIKTLRLADLDFSSSSPCLVLDIDTTEAGDVRERLAPYTTTANRELIFESWKGTPFLAETPDDVLEQLAAYPESVVVSTKTQDG